MQTVSYTISPTLSAHIAAIDILRTDILTVTLAPEVEHELRWSSTVATIGGSLSLSRLPITHAEIVQALTRPKPTISQTGITVAAYANALRWIGQHWTGNPQHIQAGDIAVLTAIALPQPHRTQSVFASLETDVATFCRYINSQNDHPVIVAGLIHGYFLQTPVGTLDQGKIARLASTMVFAKWGYDLRGLAHPESVWAADPNAYTFARQQSQKLGQLTPWLEYIASTIKESYSLLLADIKTHMRRARTALPLLSNRQQEIGELGSQPGSKITNRQVQMHFHISAITASRDLTKLHSLGILYAHGKGRSVYYTRV